MIKTSQSDENEAAARPVYEFAEFRLDPAKRLLLRNDETVALTPKAFDTLVFLLEHRGTIVSKETLMESLWPDTTVEESNLSQNVYTLRRALGDGKQEPRFIATVPGRGYQFVALVRRADGAAKEESTPAAGRRWPAAALMVAVIVLVAAAVVFMFQWRKARPSENAGTGHVQSIAVLPFKPLVIADRHEALELGMAETLISRLDRIPRLAVKPLGVVRFYRSLEQDPFAAGRELRVDSVLDGHIHRAGDRVRVSVRLLDIGAGKQVWAGQFDETFTDIFTVQDSIARRVADELAIGLSGPQQQRLLQRSTSDAEAYELYLKGRFFISLAQPRNAIEAFEGAVKRDPRFALAHAGLADIMSRLPIATDVPSGPVMERARRAANLALEIQPDLGEAHTALGWIAFYYEWDWSASERHFQKALSLNPNDFSGHLGYSHLLSNTARHDEALREIDRAISIEPRAPLARALKGQFLLHSGRVDDAARELTAVLRDAPAFWIAHVQMGRVLHSQQRHEEALAAFRRALDVGGSTLVRAYSATVLASMGRKPEAEVILEDLRDLARNNQASPYNVAMVYQAVGNSTAAIEWLERAHASRDVRMTFLGVDPAWRGLEQDRRFIAIVKRLNLR